MVWFGSTHSSYQILFSILFSTANSTPSLVGGIRHSDTTWNCHEISFNVMQTQEQWSTLKVCLVVTARRQCSKTKDCWGKKQESLGNPTLECRWRDDLECWLRWCQKVPGADGKLKKGELSRAVPYSGNTTYVLRMRGPSSQADKSGVSYDSQVLSDIEQ